MSIKSLILTLFLSVMIFAQEDPRIPKPAGLSRSKLNGPAMNDPIFQKEKSGFDILQTCLNTVKKGWFPNKYLNAHALQIQADLKLRVHPPRQFLTGPRKMEPMDVDVSVDGLALPNLTYKLNLNGKMGHLELIRGPSRKIIVNHEGRTFSDQPLLRSTNANLNNYRSYAMRYLGQMEHAILEGGFRLRYVGSGNYMGQLIDRVSLSKPGKPLKKGQPVPVNHMWTFWQKGLYEIWIYQGSHLPAAIFYSSIEDNIYANIAFSYNSKNLPVSLILQNNSSGFEGSTEILMDYSDDGLLQKVGFTMESTQGHAISFSAYLEFLDTYEERNLYGIPPFDFQKMNPDQQKLLILAQFAGDLLNMKSHGLQIKNFKF